MRRSGTRWILGLGVMLVGVILLLNNLNIATFEVDHVFQLVFAALFMAWGIELVFRRDGLGVSIFGIIIFLIGVNMLGEAFNWFSLDLSFIWQIFWPVVLILIGLKLIFNFKRHDKGNSKGRVAFMGGIDTGNEHFKLEDSSYIAFMGGIDLDLTHADIPEGKTEIHLTAIMGGIDVYVPEDVEVYCEGSVVLGGLDFFRKSTGGIYSTLEAERKGSTNKSIHISGDVVMGGIEIKGKTSGFQGKAD